MAWHREAFAPGALWLRWSPISIEADEDERRRVREREELVAVRISLVTP